ncbi:MAG: hypothetical protein ACRDZZ_01000 [Ilumatobacteraceae bacterium]
MTDDADPDDVMSDDDRDLLDALGRAWGDDPLPTGMIDRAAALLTWADVDDELAELLETASPELAGTRGAAATGRALEFEVADGTVVVEVELGGVAVAGQVLGIEVETVVLERPGGETDSVSVDATGRFSIPGQGPGPVRLRVARRSGADVRTDWFMI